MRFISAVILAGGQSTRMGFDKQLLQQEGSSIVGHQIAVLSAYFSDIMVASPTPELYACLPVRVIEDIHTGIGPLGGIHAALTKARGDAVFVLACDMPYPEPLYIEYMMQRLRNSAAAGENRNACLTERGGFLETMHAFYCRSALLILGQELARGNYSVQRFARIINSLIIAEAEAKPLVPGWRAFTNLNTPEDYRRFRAGGCCHADHQGV